jgi:hypothetical protein
MRIVGYCTVCHRIRQIRVNARGLIGRVPQGICAQCEEKERG